MPSTDEVDGADYVPPKKTPEQEAIERQLRDKINEIQRNRLRAIEREADQEKALRTIEHYDLQGVHERLEEKLADLHGVREQRAEQVRFVRNLTLTLETARLDALAEMESQPNYTPGKNEEQRRRQRDSWLATHNGYRNAQQSVRVAEMDQDKLELEEHRIHGELSSLKSLISIRQTEMDLIAAFVGR